MTLAYPVAPIEMAMFQLLSVVFGALVIVTAIRRGRESDRRRLDPRARVGVDIR